MYDYTQVKNYTLSVKLHTGYKIRHINFIMFAYYDKLLWINVAQSSLFCNHSEFVYTWLKNLMTGVTDKYEVCWCAQNPDIIRFVKIANWSFHGSAPKCKPPSFLAMSGFWTCLSSELCLSSSPASSSSLILKIINIVVFVSTLSLSEYAQSLRPLATSSSSLASEDKNL